MNAFKKTPPKKKIDNAKAEKFIKDAEKIAPEDKETSTKKPAVKDKVEKEEVKVNSAGMPWDSANDAIKKGLNLRLTESQWLKMKFIQEKTNLSLQKIVSYSMRCIM